MLLDKDRRGIKYHLGSSGWTKEPPWRQVLRDNASMEERDNASMEERHEERYSLRLAEELYVVRLRK